MRSLIGSTVALALCLAGACGGESEKRELRTPDGTAGGTGQPEGARERPVFDELPIDFRAQCPAAGCTLKLRTPDLSGVWSYCNPNSTTNTPTFDFGAACPHATKSLSSMPYPDDEDHVDFVNHGIDYDWGENEAWCVARSLLLTPRNEVLEPYCSNGVSRLTGLDFAAAGPLLYVADDGSTYLYGSSHVGESFDFVTPLATGDTASLVTACSSAPIVSGPCETDGITFPFGPTGVGAPPNERLARTWRRCYGAAATDNDDKIAKWCALDAVEEYYRFNADGTLDLLDGTGDNTGCRQATIGATDTELDFFYCRTAPSESGDASRLGTGHISAVTTPYEIRTIDGTDYLFWHDPNVLGEVGVIAVAQPDLDLDPCAGAVLPACVLGEGP